MRERVAYSREQVAKGVPVATVARTMKISRQALYRRPTPRLHPQSKVITDEVEQMIVDLASSEEYAQDGYRMIQAVTSRRLGRAVNAKRVLRVMRKHGVICRRRVEPRPKRPGYFVVRRPDELWHMDMTSIWVAEHGWCYLFAAIDCCTREIAGWSLEIRCRAVEAIAVIEGAAKTRGIAEGQLVLGTDIQTQCRPLRSLDRPAGDARIGGAGARPPSLGLRAERNERLLAC